MESLQGQLINYDSLADRQVMVLGTFHFSQDVLEEKNQAGIQQLLSSLKAYQPSKILLEWEPKRFAELNGAYQRFLQDSFDISERSNEVFQLGFRFAKEMGHDSVYLFDDQTEYIGSLEAFRTKDDPFSFDLFGEYARQEDQGFFDAHQEALTYVYTRNLRFMDKLDLKSRIALMNSPAHQQINAQRMHMFEVRVGIQKNWVGPDWLGRWYRRNVRMMANALILSEPGDRVLIIVGDNHKWFLDRLFEDTPDFELMSSWEYLK